MQKFIKMILIHLYLNYLYYLFQTFLDINTTNFDHNYKYMLLDNFNIINY